MKAVFVCDSISDVKRVYSEKALALIREHTILPDIVYSKDDVISDPTAFLDTEYVFSTWGMPVFTSEEVRRIFPSLKCVFYGAGTVQHFAREFLENGVKVFSAWAANAVPVAEYTVAQIILANKGFFASSAHMSVGRTNEARSVTCGYQGNFGGTVGIIGAGMIGSLVIRMLKEYRLNCVVFDPFLSDSAAEDLGVTKCTLPELFSRCNVVSNHLANNVQTRGMLTGELFSLMKPYSTFINTGRGAQVVESELCETLKARPDIIAILDVTDPEPPEQDSPFFTLPNCILTPHIAGSMGREVTRMSEYIAEEFCRFVRGEECLYEVSRKMLETMA